MLNYHQNLYAFLLFERKAFCGLSPFLYSNIFTSLFCYFMKRLLYFLIFIFCCSCSDFSELISEEVTQNMIENNRIEVIPVEDALSALDNFLSDNGMLQTKSGLNRTYSDVSIYFRDCILTKSDSGEDLPTAYVVNFDNNEGFAVLGANDLVPDIIAVTEEGQIDPVNLKVVPHLETIDNQLMFKDMDDSEIDEFNSKVTFTTDSLFYSTEDEDYYVGAVNSDGMATALIQECIRVSYDTTITIDGETNIGSSPGTSTTNRYNTQSPLLTYSWAQASPYNYFCKRGLMKDKEAYTGCSSTAMAMIVAYNEFPQTLIINRDTLSYPGMKGRFIIQDISEPYADQIALLMGGIYNFVTKVTTSSFTLITPKQIQKRMQEFGYLNVVKTDASSLTTSMIDSISNMLGDDKPVFISAIPKGIKNWKSGHSWVVDGAKYSSNNTYLLHMNFGWEGTSNGYYATNSINPSKAFEFDDNSIDVSDSDYVYNWHFRIITYDVPSSQRNFTITYGY